MIALALLFSSAATPYQLAPIRLHAGSNSVANIAGDGRNGTINLTWRENGNAWGYDIYTVNVGGSVATVEGNDRFTDRPHTGEDMIISVRFARGAFAGRITTFALVAERDVIEGAPSPAATTVKIYALRRNPDPIGTPYEFSKIRELRPVRHYCNADMALKTELGFPLAKTYSGPTSPDGCF